jgi:hypothetical protein
MGFRSTGYGSGWVRATAGGFQFPQIVTYGGYPGPVTVSIQSMSNGSYTGIASTPAAAKTVEYRWTVTPYPGVPNTPLLHSVTITPPVGYHSERHIIVEAHNACSMGTVSASIPEGNRYQSYASAYPNPASGILNIEIDGQAFARSVKSDPVFDIRLYNGQGNLLRQKKISGGKTEFNVSSLPAGIYYLHVYDGVSDKPDMRQIIVER